MKRGTIGLISAPVSLALALALSPATADAGKLGKVAKGISGVQSSSRGSGASSGSGSTSHSNYYRNDVYFHDDYYHSGRAHYYYMRTCASCEPVLVRRKPTQKRSRTRVDLFGTYQNVSDSDGALNLDVRLSGGAFGFGFASSSYFESDRLDKGEPVEDVRLTQWAATLRGRMVQIRDSTEMWLSLGVAGLHSNLFDNTMGGVAGIDMRHNLTRGFNLDGSARAMLYSDDLRAVEYRAGVSVSALHVGYRYLRFNVGPALEGPEIGLSVRF